MSWLNAALRVLFDTVLLPFRSLPPLAGLSVVSLAAALGMLFVFRATSNQHGIADAKRAILAGLLEVRLFNDDVGAVVRAQLDVLRHNLTYLRLSLVPLAWMLVPFGLMAAHLHFHYGYDGLTPGQAALLKVQLEPEAAVGAPEEGPPVTLTAPPGLDVTSPAVWMPALSEIAWRVTAEQPGVYDLVIHVAGRQTLKRVLVSDDVVRRSPARVAPGFMNELFYPAELPLEAGLPIRAIEITYPARAIVVFGVALPWLAVFFVLAFAFAFLLRGWVGVTF